MCSCHIYLALFQVLSRHTAGDFGFLQMAMECPRPALAEALLQTGRKRLTCNQVKRFAVASKHALGHGPEEEQKILGARVGGFSLLKTRKRLLTCIFLQLT